MAQRISAQCARRRVHGLCGAQCFRRMPRRRARRVAEDLEAKVRTLRAQQIEADRKARVAVHNGRLLICSQPVTLTPLISNMGSGFQCTVINASTGDLTLSSGFVSSSGSLVLAPWESATLSCATYSAGTIAFAAMSTTSAAAISVPGQVGGVSSSGHNLLDNHCVMAGTVERRRCFVLHCAISPDRDDHLEQRCVSRGRDSLPTHGASGSNKLRCDRAGPEYGRRQCSLVGIDRGDIRRDADGSALSC